MPDRHRYKNDASAAIDSAAEVLKLQTDHLEELAVVLHSADENADYLVEAAYDDSLSDAEWHTLADNDATQSFRFQGTVPERWVRVRVDTTASANSTAHLSISAAE